MYRSVFRPQRIFYRSEVRDRATGAGWYFQAREGREFGPFDTRPRAEDALLAFVRDCIKRGDTGGRPEPRVANR